MTMRIGTEERRALDAIVRREGPLAMLEEVVRYWEVAAARADAKNDTVAWRRLYDEKQAVQKVARKIAACRVAGVSP